jgi:hypothetical protein
MKFQLTVSHSPPLSGVPLPGEVQKSAEHPRAQDAPAIGATPAIGAAPAIGAKVEEEAVQRPAEEAEAADLPNRWRGRGDCANDIASPS